MIKGDCPSNSRTFSIYKRRNIMKAREIAFKVLCDIEDDLSNELRNIA